MDRPETLFAWNGDVALAYQVVGEGAVDLVYLQGYVSQVDMNWESLICRDSCGGWRGIPGSSSPIDADGVAPTGSPLMTSRTSTS